MKVLRHAFINACRDAKVVVVMEGIIIAVINDSYVDVLQLHGTSNSLSFSLDTCI